MATGGSALSRHGRAALADDPVCGKSVMASGGVAESAFALVLATRLDSNQLDTVA